MITPAQTKQCQMIVEQLADGNFYSGEELNLLLNTSRTTVWKIIHTLKNLGIDIVALHGKGYKIPGGMELLTQKAILSYMPVDIAELLASLQLFFVIDSTNRYLLEEVRKGSVAPRVCIAECQTFGHGRRGRPWFSPFGCNIYCSLHWCFNNPLASLIGLPLAISVAVLRTLKYFGITVQVKWPNDICFEEQKLAGILVEVVGDAAGPCHAVIGIGLNVQRMRGQSKDYLIDQPWLSLESLCVPAIPLSRNKITAKLLEVLVQVLNDYEQFGLAPFLDEWRAADSLLGVKVKITTPTETMIGIAQGIDDSGALIVDCDNQRQYFRGNAVSIRKYD